MTAEVVVAFLHVGPSLPSEDCWHGSCLPSVLLEGQESGDADHLLRAACSHLRTGDGQGLPAMDGTLTLRGRKQLSGSGAYRTGGTSASGSVGSSINYMLSGWLLPMLKVIIVNDLHTNLRHSVGHSLHSQLCQMCLPLFPALGQCHVQRLRDYDTSIHLCHSLCCLLWR